MHASWPAQPCPMSGPVTSKHTHRVLKTCVAHLSMKTLPPATNTRCDAAVPQTRTLSSPLLVRVKLASCQVAPPSKVRQMLHNRAGCGAGTDAACSLAPSRQQGCAQCLNYGCSCTGPPHVPPSSRAS